MGIHNFLEVKEQKKKNPKEPLDGVSPHRTLLTTGPANK